MLTPTQYEEALAWYVQGFSMATIAHHYGITFDELAAALNNV